MIVWMFGLVAFGADPAWGELTPWRTHVLLENVGEAHRWYVVTGLSTYGGRCEVGFADKAPSQAPMVYCGPARIGDEGAPRSSGSKKEVKRAKDALVTFGIAEPQVKDARFAYLGTLKRVTVRQVVALDGGSEPEQTATAQVLESWDVVLDSGRLLPGPISPEVSTQALCEPGRHVGCDAPPRRFDWSPSTPGTFVDVRRDDVDDADVKGLSALIRGAAMGEASFAMPADDQQGVLPDGYAGGLTVRVLLKLNQGDGDVGGNYALHLPLDGFSTRGASARVALDMVPVTLEVVAGASELVVRLRPDGERYLERKAGLTCTTAADGADLAVRSCTTDWDGGWLRWAGSGSTVWVQVRGVEPRFSPTRTPELEELPRPSVDMPGGGQFTP